MGGSIRTRIRLFCHDRRGVSAIEFAIIAPTVLLLMLGAYDLGDAAQRQIALQEAVRTGGEYALHFPTNPTAVKAAVMGALPAGWTLTNPGGTPVVTCSCGGAGTYTDCSAPPAGCTDPMLVSITATMAYTPITPLPVFAGVNNTATYVSRFH